VNDSLAPQTGFARSALMLGTAVVVVLAVLAAVVTLQGRLGPAEATPAPREASAVTAPVVLHAPAARPGSSAEQASVLGDRVSAAVSRSQERSALDVTKKRVLDQRSGGQVTRTEHLTPKNPRVIARLLLARYGFGPGQFSCLDSIYTSESGWQVHADNPTSSAYGIPQALPGSKMATAGRDWHDNPATQIRWGLGYIKASYGSPCSALSFRQSHGWY